MGRAVLDSLEGGRGDVVGGVEIGIAARQGDDVPPGKLTSFPQAVQLEPEETAVFSWVRWPSKASRDQGMKKFMEDDRLKAMGMPFDGNRMIYGGFQIIVDA